MFISPAHAQEAAAQAGGFAAMLQAFLPLILIFAIFYLLLIRPQRQRMKQHQQMVANLRRGDRVVTAGGLIGTVTRVYDDEAMVELADGVRVRVVRATISEVRAKTEPAGDGKRKSRKDDKRARPADDERDDERDEDDDTESRDDVHDDHRDDDRGEDRDDDKESGGRAKDLGRLMSGDDGKPSA